MNLTRVRPLLGSPWLPFPVLIVANVLFRLPPLLNARGVHSDAAIVGLQAMHMLHGELSFFLWGAPYQGSLDAFFIAIGFALAGVSALALMLVPFAGHLLLTAFAFGVVQRYLPRWAAMVVCLPIVFTPQAINGVVLYAPRQWCLTFFFAAVWFIDGAASRRRPWAHLFTGVMLAVVALYLDLFALQMMGALGLLGLACSLDQRPHRRELLRRLAAGAAGLVVGATALGLMRLASGAATPQTRLTFDRIAHNWNLLREQCLPWLASAKVFIPISGRPPVLWAAPEWLQTFLFLSASLLGIGICAGFASLFVRRIPWELRRLGLFGSLASLSSVVGFLLSSMPADAWSARYLAPIVWTAPFSLAPVLWLLGTQRFSFLLAPYLLSAALNGWLSYGEYVDGPRIVRTERGQAREEEQVAQALRARGVQYGAAQFWLAYRLTFLWGERPILVPLHHREDRYAPYLEGFRRASKVAYVFHPSEPRARAEDVEPWLRSQPGQVERFQVADFVVLVHTRR